MARRMLLLFAVCLTGLTLAAAGCGGDGEESAAEETVATLTETTTEETTTEETTTEETTTEDTETTEETTTDELSSDTSFATSENCQEFAQIGAKISESLTGSSDVSDIEEAFSQYASAAPDDIKDDFQTLADFFGEVANAVGNLQTGETPSAEDLAALQSLDSAAATQASQNIATWVQENCTS